MNFFSFICEHYNHVINLKDNLNRTPLHYACIMNDDSAIQILHQANAKKVKEIFGICLYDKF
jgi:ankyrin repeat protein